jgi:uncharacterized protein (PEP-CTERM system associated)
MNTAVNYLKYLSGMAILIWSAGVHSVSFDFQSGISVFEYYSDNIDLAQPGQEQSDLITEITPTIALTGEGDRFDMVLDYRYQYFDYLDDSDRDSRAQQLEFESETELISNKFIFYADASLNQVIVDPDAPGASVIESSDNISDRSIYTLRPYFFHRFSNGSLTSLSYSVEEIQYEDNTLEDSATDVIEFEIDTSDTQNRVWWQLNYSEEAINFDGRIDETQDPDAGPVPGYESEVIFEEGFLTIGYLLRPGFTVFATAGHEDNQVLQDSETGVLESRFEDDFRSAGFTWAPTASTTLEAEKGERFFGDTKSFEFTHRRPGRSWNISYAEDVSADPLGRIDEASFSRLDDFGVPLTEGQALGVSNSRLSYTSSIFLEKTLEMSYVQRFTRSLLVLEAERVERTSLQTAADREEVDSWGISFEYDLGSRSQLLFSTAQDKVKERVGNDLVINSGDITTESSVGFNWRYAGELQFAALIRKQKRESETIETNNYEELLSSIGILMRF